VHVLREHLLRKASLIWSRLGKSRKRMRLKYISGKGLTPRSESQRQLKRRTLPPQERFSSLPKRKAKIINFWKRGGSYLKRRGRELNRKRRSSITQGIRYLMKRLGGSRKNPMEQKHISKRERKKL